MFTGLDHLGLEVTGQPVKTQNAVQACRVVEPDDWCHRCGEQGVARGNGAATAGACAVRVATADAVGHGASLQVHRVRSCVASGPLAGGDAGGEDLPGLGGVGTGWPWGEVVMLYYSRDPPVFRSSVPESGARFCDRPSASGFRHDAGATRNRLRGGT